MKHLRRPAKRSSPTLPAYKYSGPLIFMVLAATVPAFSGESGFQRTVYSAGAGLQGRIVLDVSAGSFIESVHEETGTGSSAILSGSTQISGMQGFSAWLRINVVPDDAWHASITFPVKISIPADQGSLFPQVTSLLSVSRLSGTGFEGLRTGLDMDAVSLIRLMLTPSGTTPGKESLPARAEKTEYFMNARWSGSSPVFGEAAENELMALWITKTMISDPVILSGSLHTGAGKRAGSPWNAGFRLGIEFVESLNQRVALKLEAADAFTCALEPGGLRFEGSKIEAAFSVVRADDSGLREAGITMSHSTHGSSIGFVLGYSGLTGR